MGIVQAVPAVSVVLVAGMAHAQQEPPSPYSLGLSVGHVPLGLNLSVVGSAQFSSFTAFGKLGNTTSTRPDTSQMGMASAAPSPANELGSGLSWGGGVSWSFTPRLAATFEWVSYDLRMPAKPMRLTTLGLQYRY